MVLLLANNNSSEISSSPLPRPSPPSPSALPVGLFACSPSVSPPLSSSLTPKEHEDLLAANSLIEFSDLVTCLSQSKTVPPSLRSDLAVDKNALDTHPSHTLRKQLDRIKAKIWTERQRACALESELRMALQERMALLHVESPEEVSDTGPEDNDDCMELGCSLPFPLPALSPMQKDSSAPVLPPISSIPAFKPYLKPPALCTSASAGSPLIESEARRLKRRKTLEDEDEDKVYKPSKRVGRNRSVSDCSKRTVKKKVISNYHPEKPYHDELQETSNNKAKEAGVLYFIKHHPHASFWLSRANEKN